MDKTKLRQLGTELRESITTTANAEAFIRDLTKRLSKGEVTVKVKAVAKGVLEYTFLSTVKEEAIEVQSAANIWNDNEDSAAKYISTAVYSARPVEGGEKFDVSIEKGSKRIPFATLSKDMLAKSFTETHPNQQTDNVEDLVQYRSNVEVEAIQYGGGTIKLNTGDLLSRGDYLIRKVDGEDFIYEVQKSKDFEASYAKK